MKLVIILRHVSGAGASTLAKTLAALNKNSCICEADDYFINDTGEYIFDSKKLGLAHSLCRRKFEDAIKSGVELIICGNTNTTLKEYKFYLDKAKERGYIVHVVIIENVHDTKNVHNVPSETLDRQKNNILSSIKL